MTMTVSFGRLSDGERAFAFGLNGLTLFVETPWVDAWFGRHAGLLIHRRAEPLNVW